MLMPLIVATVLFLGSLLVYGTALSTAMLFAIMSELIAHRLRSETGYQSEAAGIQAAPSVAGGA
jgi:hypothetical protein